MTCKICGGKLRNADYDTCRECAENPLILYVEDVLTRVNSCTNAARESRLKSIREDSEKHRGPNHAESPADTR